MLMNGPERDGSMVKYRRTQKLAKQILTFKYCMKYFYLELLELIQIFWCTLGTIWLCRFHWPACLKRCNRLSVPEVYSLVKLCPLRRSGCVCMCSWRDQDTDRVGMMGKDQGNFLFCSFKYLLLFTVSMDKVLLANYFIDSVYNDINNRWDAFWVPPLEINKYLYQFSTVWHEWESSWENKNTRFNVFLTSQISVRK